MNMRILFIISILWILSLQAFSLELELFLRKQAVEVNGELISACSFSTQEEFDTRNEIIELAIGESLQLTIYNEDSLVHSFVIDGILESDNQIPAYGTLQLELGFDQAGTYRYYSNYSYGELIGASGIILVGYPGEAHFFWNLFDLNRELSNELASVQIESIPSDYQPELFFINGRFFPNTLDDPQALVSLELNESAIISVVNSGYMDHVLHFHGFHIEVLTARMQGGRVGWIKDTIPLKSGEAMTFRLVADLEGIYPVHDHNLIAVTNIGFYPGGMLTQIHVGQ